MKKKYIRNLSVLISLATIALLFTNATSNTDLILSHPGSCSEDDIAHLERDMSNLIQNATPQDGADENFTLMIQNGVYRSYSQSRNDNDNLYPQV